MHIKYCLTSFSNRNFCFCGRHSSSLSSLTSAAHPLRFTYDMQITSTVCHYLCGTYTPFIHINVRASFLHRFIFGWRLLVWVKMWNVRCTDFLVCVRMKNKMEKINNRKWLVFQSDRLNLYVNGSSLPVTCWHFLWLWLRKVDICEGVQW